MALIAGLTATAPARADVPRMCSGSAVAGTIGPGQSQPFQVWLAAGASASFSGTVTITQKDTTGGWQSDFTVSPNGPWALIGSYYGGPTTGSYSSYAWTNNGAAGLFTFNVQQDYGVGVQYSLGISTTGSADPNGCVSGRELLGGSNPAEPNICSCGHGDPVDTATGNYWDSHTDLAIPGRGPALALTRTYNSAQAAADGPLGWGSTFSYGMALAQPGGTGPVTISQENGSQVTFTPSGSDFTAAPRVQATLTHNGDGTWTYLRNHRDTFTFDSAGRLTGERDLNGYTTTLAYDANGHLWHVTDPEGRALTFTWTGTHITSVADPATPAHTVGYAFDANTGGLTDVTDVAGGVTHYTYDGSHQRLTIRDPRQAGVTNPPVLTNAYDASGRVTQQTDRTGAVEQFDYSNPGYTKVTDPRGHVTLAYFSGNVMTKRVTGSDTATPITTTYDHDATTQAVTKATVDNGTPPVHVTTYGYDANGNLNSVNDGVHPASTAFFNSLGLATSITDGAGTTTTFTYDVAGNVLSSSTPIVPAPAPPAPSSRVTAYHYDDSLHPGDVTSVTDPRGKTWTYTRDAYGLTSSLVEPGTAANKTTWTYNNLGWLTSTTSPRGNAPGAPAGSYTTTFSNFTNFGAWQAVTDPAGHVSTRGFDADWNLAWTKDTAGKQTSYLYDNENRPTETDRPDAAAFKTTYWPGGEMKDQIDPAGNTTTFDYDAWGRVATRQDSGGNCAASPLLLCTKYSYDAVGNLTAKVEPSGTTTPLTTTYGYDAAGQLTTVTYSDGTTPNVTSATYDGAGRRLSLVAANGTSNWTWDSLGHMLSSSDLAGSTSYAYDAGGNLTKITYPGGTNSATRVFDDAGRLQSVTDWMGNMTSFATDADGNVASQANPNGTTTATVADPLGALSSISTAPTSNPSAPVASMTYTRDALDRVTKETTTGLPDAKTLYSYDKRDQLASVNDDAYAYNANSDGRVSSATTTGPVSLLSQAFTTAGRLTTSTALGIGGRTFSYHGRGNRTAAGSDTFGWDQANRLVSASVAPSYVKSVVDNKPLGYWRFGEPSGTFADTSPYAHVGTIVGTPTRHVTPGGITTAAGDDGAATFASGSYGRVGRRGEMLAIWETTIEVTPSTPGQYQYSTSWAPGQTRDFTVLGKGNIPTSGVDSVVLSVAAKSSAAGSLSVTPSGTGAPTLNNVDFYPGNGYATNELTVRVGTGGAISIKNNGTANADLVIFTVGYYSDGSGVGYGLNRLTPARIMSTNNGLNGPSFAAGENRTFVVAGKGGVPTTGVSAVDLNVTVYNGASPNNSYLTLYNSQAIGEPTYAAVNWINSEQVANEVTVTLGSDGAIKLTNHSDASVDITIDVLGWYSSGGAATYAPLSTPQRRLDTTAVGAEYGAWGAGTNRVLQVTGTAGVPNVGVAEVLLNVTALNPSAHSVVTAYQADITQPSTIDLMFNAGQTTSNQVIVPVSPDGQIRLWNSAGTVNFVVDVIGYFKTDPLFALGTETVEFLAKKGAAGDIARAGVASGANGWAITQGSGGTLTFTRNAFSITTVGALSSTAWRHVALTYDGGTVRWYLDGALDSQQAASFPAVTAPQDAIVWGNGSVSLDEAAIYGRALSAAEIAAHRAAAVGTSSTAVSYVYDGDGTRRSKTVGGTMTSFVSDQAEGLSLLLTEDTTAGTTSYVYGPGGLPIEQVSPSGVVSYFAHDQLGSTRALLNATGSVVGTFSYDVYGKRTASMGSVATTLGFGGQYTDAETGFLYLRARSYDPATAQFLSVDPAVASTRSPYDYAGGDPINRADPFGLDWKQSTANFAGGVLNGITLGHEKTVTSLFGISGKVNRCSAFYTAGFVTGTALISVTPAGDEVAAERVAVEGRSTELAASETWGRADTLADHFARHGADFGAATEDEYAQQASGFLQQGLQDDLPTKIDPKTGDIRIYDPESNTFGSYNADGTTKTFYKPDPSVHGYPTNWDYWESQPGDSPWVP